MLMAQERRRPRREVTLIMATREGYSADHRPGLVHLAQEAPAAWPNFHVGRSVNRFDRI